MIRRVKHTTISICLLFGLLPLGCDDAEEAAPIELSLGTGIDSFEPVATGAALPITQGLQGGFHVFGAVRTRDAEAWNADFDFAMYQGDVQIGGANYKDDFLMQGDDLVYSGVTVFLFEDFPPESVADKPTRMTVKVTDREGRQGTASFEFVPTCCDYL